jgi:hypothetical protein
MTNHTLCRTVATLLLTFCWLPRASAQARVTSPKQGPYLVLAHYMPGFPALGINPANDYWYAAQYSPVYDNLTARPILYPTGGADPNLESRIAEIKIAKSYGIDGFLVDEQEDNETFRTTWLTLLQAARRVGGFYIGLQPDYATLNNPTGGDHPPQTRRDKIKHWLDLAKEAPALLRFEGKPCVIPYGAAYPDAKTYDLDKSLSSAAGEKRDLVDWMSGQGTPIAYAAMHSLGWPVYAQPYANDPKTGFQTFAFATSTFSPGDSVNTLAGGISTRQRALNYWPRDFMQIGEATFLYEQPHAHWYTAPRLSTTWRQDWAWNVAHRDRIHWVEIITWNDWGESAIAPSVNLFMALQPITRFYADWFKTGHAPVISQDVVTIFHRESPSAAVPTKYPNRILGSVLPDEVEALALLKAPATLLLKSGKTEYRQPVGAGLQSLIKPFALGVQSASLLRHGVVVASVTSPLPIHDQPMRENLWIDGETSAFPPRSLPLDDWTAVSGNWTGTGAQRVGTGQSLVGNGGQLGNISVSAYVTPEAVAESSFFGIIAHANRGGGYRFALGRWDNRGQWHLSKMEAGKETILAGGDTPYAAHAQYGLRLDCVGEHLLAYLDGHLLTPNVCDYPDWQQTPLTYGQVGLAAEGTRAKFTKISLKSYDPALGTQTLGTEK